MAESTRFRVAVHVLTLLAHEQPRALTSEYIAGSVNTNPVVIRRVLRMLSRAGLVVSTEGARGGTKLARKPGEISLQDVHHAVDRAELFPMTRSEPNPRCPVGRSVQKVLGGHVDRLEAALQKQMSRTSVSDVLAGVRSARPR
jgi:Rrf2 family protein